MLAFMIFVGLTLTSMFVGIYFGGRHTLRSWGYDCPIKGEMVRIGQKVDLRS